MSRLNLKLYFSFLCDVLWSFDFSFTHVQDAELGAINKTVMDRKQMEIGGITMGTQLNV